MRPLPHRNVFEDRGKILTKNMNKGISVYGERLISMKGVEYRQWDPKRSKLGAAIMKKVNLPKFSEKDIWLYLGSASGTSVSHISDIALKGTIYAVEFAPRVMRDFLFMAEKRDNISPILGDAFHPERYDSRIAMVDILFQDIAQKSQVDIFLKNMRFLKDSGTAIIAVKARSIDVSKKPKMIFDMVRKQFQDEVKIIDSKMLEPFEEDHCVFVCKKK
ncbi:MAG: fibrillarin-like rRNA/tRNA 2'-O-methyltransferase [Candidatus Woesearchaeota archaeon]